MRGSHTAALSKMVDNANKFRDSSAKDSLVVVQMTVLMPDGRPVRLDWIDPVEDGETGDWQVATE